MDDERLTVICRFVVEDDKYNYLSARFPPDAELLAEKAIEMVRKATQG